MNKVSKNGNHLGDTLAIEKPLQPALSPQLYIKCSSSNGLEKLCFRVQTQIIKRKQNLNWFTTEHNSQVQTKPSKDTINMLKTIRTQYMIDRHQILSDQAARRHLATFSSILYIEMNTIDSAYTVHELIRLHAPKNKLSLSGLH